MTKLLISKDNPNGYTLESVFRVVRSDILKRCADLSDDPSTEVQEVVANNMFILSQLEQIISYAESSSEIMKRIYGKNQG